jgi:hypothetical protein
MAAASNRLRISPTCAYRLRPAIQPSLYRFEREPLAPVLNVLAYCQILHFPGRPPH